MQYLETMKAIPPLVLLFLSTTLLAQNIPSIEQVEAELEELKKKDDLRAFTLELARQRDSLIEVFDKQFFNLEQELSSTEASLSQLEFDLLQATNTITEFEDSITTLGQGFQQFKEQISTLEDSLQNINKSSCSNPVNWDYNHPIDKELSTCFDSVDNATGWQMLIPSLSKCIRNAIEKWDAKTDSVKMSIIEYVDSNISFGDKSVDTIFRFEQQKWEEFYVSQQAVVYAMFERHFGELGRLESYLIAMELRKQRYFYYKYLHERWKKYGFELSGGEPIYK